MRTTRTLGAAVALAMTACAHGGPKQVSDADFGRLSPGQMQPVRQAREEQQSAREEAARAKLALEQARQELALAQADQAAADAAAQRAEAVARAADQSREPTALRRAADLGEEARLERRASQARIAWAKELIAARRADVDVAERRQESAEARVEYAKLQALQQANIPAAAKYDAEVLQRRVEDRRKATDEALRKADERDRAALAAHQAYQDARQQLAGRVLSPRLEEQGTGSSAR